MPKWEQISQRLAYIASRQIFFVGGAPRSGTTWLQQILDSHPDVCCRGEGFFLKHLLEPIESLMSARTTVIEAKNAALFSHTGGYPVPTREMTDHMVVTAILYSLAQQTEGQDVSAVGEKTPENVFLFKRLADLLPNAKLIAIARDPRDVLASAWHFFQNSSGAAEQELELFLRHSFPSLNDGAKTMIELGRCFPDRYFEVTYEALLRAPKTIVARVFRHLGVDPSPDILQRTIDATSFSAMASGQRTGDGAFFRSGSVGSWTSTLTPRMNDLILQELGWMFPHFGWSTE